MQFAFGLGARLVQKTDPRVIDGVMRSLALVHAVCRIPYLRPRIADNMRAILGARVRNRWVDRNLQALYQSVGFLLRLPAMSDEAVAAELGVIRGEDVLRRCQRDRRGCVLVGLHFGNHRFLAPGLAALGYPVSALVANFPQRQTEFGAGAAKASARFRAAYVRRAPAEYVPAHPDGRSIAAMISAVERGRFLLLMADGCIGRRRVAVRFLDQQFLLPSSAPAIASRAGVPLVPILSSRDTREVFVREPIHPQAESRAAQSLQEVLRGLEPIVTRHPWEWWTWMHIGRDRSRPGEATWRLLSGTEAFSVF